MKSYELTYLISPNLSEEEVKILQEKINSLIQKEGGILDTSQKPVKKRLGYQIKKKTTIFLKSLTFYFNPEKLGNLEKKLKEDENILRYITLTKEKLKAIPKFSGEPKISKPKRRVKVELKEIEKKLEEILEE